MFQRFTDQSRRAIVLAQEEASRLNHGYVGTEHMLAGLVREDRGAAGHALRPAGVTLDAVRERLEARAGRGQSPPSGHISFTPRAKKSMELSLREALKTGHDFIGTGHLLLGLTRNEECTAAQVLGDLGVDLGQLRVRVIGAIRDHREGPEPVPPPGPGEDPDRAAGADGAG